MIVVITFMIIYEKVDGCGSGDSTAGPGGCRSCLRSQGIATTDETGLGGTYSGVMHFDP